MLSLASGGIFLLKLARKALSIFEIFSTYFKSGLFTMGFEHMFTGIEMPSFSGGTLLKGFEFGICLARLYSDLVKVWIFTMLCLAVDMFN